MVGEAYKRAKQVFEAAAELPAPEREAFIQGQCAGDTDLLAFVRGMLAANDQADRGGFLQNPTDGGRTATIPLREAPGTVIGRYKLLQQIGEGGFGVVFLAEQREPVKRRVALKIIKLGMDTRVVVARFEAERQALAMMDHPNIAKVLDAGATESGRPYFVMELVKGDPITGYCDTHNLSVEERLGLFREVCHAVQHAHQKGIIHRDIKPRNVLVTVADGKPIPKVIDFGIAKATSARLTEKTLFTEHRALIGTPEYMSPEQAEMSGVDIDTRSDIYSLGVLLYELLTGALPFDAQRLRSAAFGEIQRIIREEDPPNPSTRLSTLETLASVAAHRHTEPARLSRLVKGDLDWIVMKALEKDRTRRYETANGLAADVERHLAGEPVMAAPPSTAYRVRKFVRRHKVGVGAGAAIAATLILGIVGTALGLVRAEQKRRDAEAAWAAEAQQRAAADKARKRAEAINEFVNKALVTSDPNQGGKQDTLVADAMMNAIKELDTGAFKDDPETEAGLRGIIGMILVNNGRAAEAEPLLVQALETRRWCFRGDRRDVAESLNHLALVLNELGRQAEAEAFYVQALEMRRRFFTDDHPDVAESLSNVAHVRMQLGRAAEGEPLFVQALEMDQRLFKGDHPCVANSMNNLASVRLALGRAAEAEPLYVQALEMHQRLFKADHPEVAEGLHNLARVRLELGRAAEAEPLYVQALEMYRRLFKGDHPHLAMCLLSLGNLRLEMGRAAEAEPLYAQGLEMYRRLFKGDHPSVARGLNLLANVRHTLGRAAEAEVLDVEALEMYRRLFKGDHPQVVWSLCNLASVCRSLGRVAEAEPLFREALEMARRLFGGDHPAVGHCPAYLAGLLEMRGDLAGAEPLWREAQPMWLRLVPEGHTAVAASMSGLGQVLEDRAWHGRADRDIAPSAARTREAETILREGLSIGLRALASDSPNLAVIRSALGGAIVAVEATRRPSPGAGDEPTRTETATRLREAEGLLTEGYNGLAAAADAVPAPEGSARRQRKAAERLVRLYTLWDEFEPGSGKSDQAARWRARLVELGGAKEPPESNSDPPKPPGG